MNDPIETRDPEAIRAHKAKGGQVEARHNAEEDWGPCYCGTNPLPIDHRLLPLDPPDRYTYRTEGFRLVHPEPPAPAERPYCAACVDDDPEHTCDERAAAPAALPPGDGRRWVCTQTCNPYWNLHGDRCGWKDADPCPMSPAQPATPPSPTAAGQSAEGSAPTTSAAPPAATLPAAAGSSEKPTGVATGAPSTEATMEPVGSSSEPQVWWSADGTDCFTVHSEGNHTEAGVAQGDVLLPTGDDEPWRPIVASLRRSEDDAVAVRFRAADAIDGLCDALAAAPDLPPGVTLPDESKRWGTLADGRPIVFHGAVPFGWEKEWVADVHPSTLVAVRPPEPPAEPESEPNASEHAIRLRTLAALEHDSLIRADLHAAADYLAALGDTDGEAPQ